MPTLDNQSLSGTLDVVNEAAFFARSLRMADRKAVTAWLLGRCGQRGSYEGMPAPTPQDFAEGVRVFTGERLRTGAGVAHILGEEACRALRGLAPDDPHVQQAMDAVSARLIRRMRGQSSPGWYCCMRCSVALWRHVSAGGLDRQEARLTAGAKLLKARRDGKGQWRGFPFHYAVLALSEIDLPVAKKELLYAAPVLERSLRRASPAEADKYAARRRALAQRVLAGV